MIVGCTFDRTDITLDQLFPTWDCGLYAGVVQCELDDGTRLAVDLATVRTQSFTYDRSMFRSPYGTVWHQEGDERRLVENVNLSVHFVDDADGISDAADAARVLVAAAPNVVLLESPIGSFEVVALLSYTRQPVESGYRFDFTFATFDGLRV